MFEMTLSFESYGTRNHIKSAEWKVLVNTREAAHAQLERVLEALDIARQPEESPGDPA